MVNLVVDYQTVDSGWSSAVQNQSEGVKITPNRNIRLRRVLKANTCTYTRCRLLNSAGTLIETATVSNDTATFNDPVLTSGTAYRIEWDASGGNYDAKYKAYILPLTLTHFTINATSVGGSDNTTWTRAIISITTYVEPSTKGEREIKSTWDYLTSSDSTKEIGHEQNLVPEETIVPQRKRAGIS